MHRDDWVWEGEVGDENVCVEELKEKEEHKIQVSVKTRSVHGLWKQLEDMSDIRYGIRD